MNRLDVSIAGRRHLGAIARGGTLGLAGAGVAGVAGFVFVLVVARGLPATDAGIFFAATAAFVIIEGLAVFGTDTGLGRFLLRHEAERRSGALLATLRGVLWTCGALAVTHSVMLWTGAEAIDRLLGWHGQGAPMLKVLACALPAAVVTDLCLSATRAFSEIRSTVLVDRLARSGLQPVLAVVVLARGGGLIDLAVAWAATHVIASVLAVVALQRSLVRRGHGSLRSAPVRTPGVLREFWEFTWLRGLARFAQVGIQKADIILVAALVSPAAATAYTVATRFVPVGQLATQAIQQILQPRLTAILISADRRVLLEVYRVATAWNILLVWPLHIGVMALASSYLGIFGAAATGVGQVELIVVVMAASMMIAVASGPVDTLLLMSGRSRASAANAFAALGIDLLLCVLLLPVIGVLGAAVAWAAAVTTRCGLAFVQVHRSLDVHPLAAVTARAAALPVVVVGVPAWLLGRWDPALPWLVAGIAAIALAYLAVLVRMRTALALDHLGNALTAGRRRSPR